MSTAESYNELPYTCHPQAETHPNRLASVVRLLGLQPPPLATARILELGCADGTNLMASALSLPLSTCVGIDYSARQIEQGNIRLAQLGLKNVQLKMVDILNLTEDLGEFDYIIVHGVYSWVSVEVQDKLLALCASQLSPNGVAYVSYNTRPGWNMRSTIRDMLLYHTQQFDTIPKKVNQVHAWLDFLHEYVDDKLTVAGEETTEGNQPFYHYLHNESQFFTKADDDYLFHEFLEEHNTPVYFHEFMHKAQAYGLGYAGDANLMQMFREFKLPKASKILGELDTLHREQYIDFLENRQFRQTLLCHEPKIHGLEQQADIIMRDFYFASSLQPNNPQQDLTQNGAEIFENDRIRVSEDEPLNKAVLWHLARVYPQVLTLAEIEQKVMQTLGSVDVLALAKILAKHAAANVLDLHSIAPCFALEIEEYPLSNPLARLQIEDKQSSVSNLNSQSINLKNPILSQMMCYLDGTRSHEDLKQILAEWIEAGKITPPVGVEVNSETLGQVLQSILKSLMRNALLLKTEVWQQHQR